MNRHSLIKGEHHRRALSKAIFVPHDQNEGTAAVYMWGSAEDRAERPSTLPLWTRVGITESTYAPTTVHVVIPAKAGTQLRAWVPAFVGMTTWGTKRHRQMKHLFPLRSFAISVPRPGTTKIQRLRPILYPDKPVGEVLLSYRLDAERASAGIVLHQQTSDLSDYSWPISDAGKVK